MPHSGFEAVIFVLRSHDSISCWVTWAPCADRCRDLRGGVTNGGGAELKSVPKSIPFVSEEAATNGFLTSWLPASLSASQETHGDFDRTLQALCFPGLTADARLASGTEPAACGNRAIERWLSSTGRAWQSFRIKRLCIDPHPTLPLGLRFHTRKLKRQPERPRC